jgi:Rrf2 family protein
MRLQISTRLAIFAALELTAHENRQLSVADIGAKYSVSSHHLAKVMHIMGRAGLVRAIRGAGGGYRFAGNPRRTTLLDVVQLFEDVSSVEKDTAVADATSEGQALQAILTKSTLSPGQHSDQLRSRRCISFWIAGSQPVDGTQSQPPHVAGLCGAPDYGPNSGYVVHCSRNKPAGGRQI